MINKNLLLGMIILLSISVVYSQDKALEISETGEVTVEKELIVKTKITNTATGSTYDPLPAGTILMYSGKDWVDNSTLPGWYACELNGDGSAKVIGTTTVPNLRDKFIKGGGNDNAQTPGGSNHLKLTEAQMPAHNHAIDHNHPPVTVTKTSITTYMDSTSLQAKPYLAVGTDSRSKADTPIEAKVHFSTTVDIPLLDQDSSTRGGHSTFNNQPSYYTVIYIMKVE